MVKVWLQFKENLKVIKQSLTLVYRSSPKGIFFILFFTIVSGLIPPLNLLIYRLLINALVDAVITSELYNVLFCFFFYWLFQLIDSVSNGLNRYFKEMQSDHIQIYITKSLLEKVEKMRMSEFDIPEIYDDINKINGESGRIAGTVDSIFGVLTSLISLMGIVGILFSYNKFIVFIAMLSFLPTFLVEMKIYLKLHSIYMQRIEKLRLVQALRTLMLKYKNINEIKIFNAGKHIKNIILKTYRDYINEDATIRKNNTIKHLLLNFAESIAGLTLKLYFLISGIYRRLQVGDITMYLNTIDYFMTNFKLLLITLSRIYQDNLYIKTVFDFLNRNYKTDPQSTKKFDSNFGVITFKDVCFKYPKGDRLVLNNVNIEFKKSKSYLIVGVNGAGKTTLVKLLSNLYAPTSGYILVDGVDLKEVDAESYRSKISVVFQDFIKYPLTAADNIKLGKYEDFKDDFKMVRSAQQAGSDCFINALPNKYQTILQNEWTDGTEISQGQWQKLAISRAFFSGAPIVIMDEPAAALDAYAENELYKELSTMMKEKTTIMISHRYTTAKIVDEIIVLDGNTVIEQGSYDELINSRGKFSEMFRLQAQKYNLQNEVEFVND